MLHPGGGSAGDSTQTEAGGRGGQGGGSQSLHSAVATHTHYSPSTTYHPPTPPADPSALHPDWVSAAVPLPQTPTKTKVLLFFSLSLCVSVSLASSPSSSPNWVRNRVMGDFLSYRNWQILSGFCTDFINWCNQKLCVNYDCYYFGINQIRINEISLD